MPEPSQNWQSGRPLSDVFSALIEADEQAEKDRKHWESTTAHPSSTPAVDQAIYQRARQRSLTRLKQSLAAGRTSALGIRTGANPSRGPVEIPRRFWLSAHPFPEEDRAQDGSEEYIQITIESDVLQTSAVKVPAPPKRAGGRPNQKERAKKEIRVALGEPEFKGLPNRRAQAEEIRARLEGESARFEHDMAGLKDTSLIRWIGELARE
tara:strand:- start:8080 stop:8706 length:627 start_codon:yes stop_codon:yes gene_type:complete